MPLAPDEPPAASNPVKRGGRVFAIEADPSSVKILRYHLALNCVQGVEIFQMAALDCRQQVGLRLNPRNRAGSTVVTGDSIQADTIDSLMLPRIDVCKMDIEGSELKALHGMQETMKRSPALKLLIECNEMSDQKALLAFPRERFSSITPLGQLLKVNGIQG